MRWLFLFVLSLNFVYVGWQVSQISSESYADVPALKNVQTIVLLSELKQQTGLAGVKQAGANKEERVAADEDVEEPTTENVSASKADSEPIGSADVSVTAPEAAVEKPEVLPEVVQQAEQKVVKPPVVEVEVAAEQLSSTKASPAKSASCYTLGPFRDLDKLRGLTREIKSYVVATDFRGREEREQTLYWVYVQPEKNRARAIETGKRLKAKKIKDFYVIRDGEKINGLSLGHFRNKDGAYGLAKKVKKLGFEVIVEPVFKTYTIYWLDYELASGVTIPESIFEKHARSSKKNKISRLSRDCAGG